MIKITKKYKKIFLYYLFSESIWLINLFAKSIFDVFYIWNSLFFLSKSHPSFLAKEPNPWPARSIGFANI